jgi:hypothetical protein
MWAAPVVKNSISRVATPVSPLEVQWQELVNGLNGTRAHRTAATDSAPAAPIQTEGGVVAAVQWSGIALSVGMIWWVSRLGGLLTALASASPAWRQLDPLPILGAPAEEEDEQNRRRPERKRGTRNAEREEHLAARLLDG